jgi:hypothetical protein
MHIRIDERHLQFGPVTVDLSRQHLLALICRLAAPHQRPAETGSDTRPVPSEKGH